MGNWCAVGLYAVAGPGTRIWWTETINYVSTYYFYENVTGPIQFRLIKSGGAIQSQINKGTGWINYGSTTVTWPYLFAGVYAQGRLSGGAKGEFDYIRFSCTRTASSIGTYTSKQLDLGVVPALAGTISWSCSIFLGSIMDLKTRTSADGISWGGWSGTYATSTGSTISSVGNRFIQFKVDLTENTNLDSPILDWVNISYPGIPPNAPVISSSDYQDAAWGRGDPVNLTWTQTADSPAPVFAYYYAVDAFPVNTGALTLASQILSATVHATSIYGLLEGGHEYYLVAQGEPAEYPLSGVTKFRILKDTVPPGSVSIASPTHPTLDESPNDAPLFTVLATDTETTTDFISGVSAYFYEFDQASGTVPSLVSASTSATEISFSGIADGTWWFHARARDGAGNFGPVSHYPIKISFKGQVRVAISSPTHPEGVESAGNSPEFKLTMSNPDSATIVGYHYRLDHSPSSVLTTADTFTKSEVIKYTFLDDGTWYLHAVAKNNTGTLTNTDHYGFSIKFGGKVLEEKNVHAVPSPIRGGKALIRYELMAPAGGISAEVLDGNGHRLAQLSGSFVPGRNEMTWNCSGVANGVYYLRIKLSRLDGKEETIIKKIAVIK